MSQEKPDFIGSTPITAHMRIYEQKKGHFFSHRAGTTAYKTNENRFPHIYQKPRLDPLIRRCFCLIVSHPNMTNSRMEKKQTKEQKEFCLQRYCAVYKQMRHTSEARWAALFPNEFLVFIVTLALFAHTHVCVVYTIDIYIYICECGWRYIWKSFWHTFREPKSHNYTHVSIFNKANHPMELVHSLCLLREN